MEDEQIIALYWKRDDQAISQSDAKYGRYCFSIAQHILENLQDSEECVNDTWLHAWNAMPPHKPNALRMFFAKITRELSFDRFRKRQAQKRGGGEMKLVLEELSECIVDESNVEDEAITRELAESVRLFLLDLPQEERNLFLRRYFFTESIAEIARFYGKTANGVAVQLTRIRKKLRVQLEKEGYFV